MDYRKYRLSIYETIKYSAFYILFFLLLAKLFFDSFYGGIVGFLFLPFVLRRKEKELARKRQEKLIYAFKDLILSFSAGLKAGYSIENAFLEACKDLRFIYKEKEDMMQECNYICNQMKNNRILETLLMDFGKRSGQKDIEDFAAVFVIAKRSGGSISAIIQDTANIISEKIEVKREIQLMFAAKRMEQNIMNIVPFAIVLYIRITSEGYFDVLYKNPAGIVIMSACLVIYFMAYFLSLKIMNIEV